MRAKERLRHRAPEFENGLEARNLGKSSPENSRDLDLRHFPSRFHGLPWARPAGVRLDDYRLIFPTLETRMPNVPLHRLIAGLQVQQASLSLDTTDLCFLIAIRAKAETASLTALEEDTLYEVFEMVCEQIDPGAANPRKRATNAIGHLREQRLLVRVDAAGPMRPGEYALTKLAESLVDFFTDEEGLTRESLTLITKTLKSQLADILGHAKRASSADAWRIGIVVPLRVTVGDLVTGIERRQRGMDSHQAEIQARIRTLLERDWFAAVEDCEALLDETTRTLRELDEVLLQDTAQLEGLVLDIEQAAASAGAVDAAEAARRVADQITRVTAWGTVRLRAWSDYFQFVQRFLRSVVRMDPERALSHRLREQITRWPENPFYMAVIRAPSIKLLREDALQLERPPVCRPHVDREGGLTELRGKAKGPPLADQVRQVIDDGACTLAEVLERLLPAIEPKMRYRAIGRIAAAFADHRRVCRDLDREWTAVLDAYLVEEWRAASTG